MSMGGTYKIIAVSMLVLGAATGAWLYITWKYANEENKERKLDESRLIYRRDSLLKEKEYKSEYYYRLIHDDDFAERVIREKLGYVGENEIVFRFKDSTPLSVNAKTARITPKKIIAQSENRTALEQHEDVSRVDELPTKVSKENVTEQESPTEQKSFLRRLFSREKEKSVADREIVPQIRIDMSEPEDKNNTQPVQQQEVVKNSNNDIARIRFSPETPPQNSQVKIDSDKKFQAPRVEMYLPKANVSKNRTPNSIRFRAN